MMTPPRRPPRRARDRRRPGSWPSASARATPGSAASTGPVAGPRRATASSRPRPRSSAAQGSLSLRAGASDGFDPGAPARPDPRRDSSSRSRRGAAVVVERPSGDVIDRRADRRPALPDRLRRPRACATSAGEIAVETVSGDVDVSPSTALAWPPGRSRATCASGQRTSSPAGHDHQRRRAHRRPAGRPRPVRDRDRQRRHAPGARRRRPPRGQHGRRATSRSESTARQRGRCRAARVLVVGGATPDVTVRSMSGDVRLSSRRRPIDAPTAAPRPTAAATRPRISPTRRVDHRPSPLAGRPATTPASTILRALERGEIDVGRGRSPARGARGSTRLRGRPMTDDAIGRVLRPRRRRTPDRRRGRADPRRARRSPTPLTHPRPATSGPAAGRPKASADEAPPAARSASRSPTPAKVVNLRVPLALGRAASTASPACRSHCRASARRSTRASRARSSTSTTTATAFGSSSNESEETDMTSCRSDRRPSTFDARLDTAYARIAGLAAER